MQTVCWFVTRHRSVIGHAHCPSVSPRGIHSVEGMAYSASTARRAEECPEWPFGARALNHGLYTTVIQLPVSYRVHHFSTAVPNESSLSKMTYPTALTTTNSNPRLRLLQGLKAGTKPVMTFMGLPSVRTAQIVALTGVDVSLTASSEGCADPSQSIILDCEHGHISDDSMHNSVAAISALNVSPLIRIRAPLPDLIKRALDTGAQYVHPRGHWFCWS